MSNLTYFSGTTASSSENDSLVYSVNTSSLYSNSNNENANQHQAPSFIDLKGSYYRKQNTQKSYNNKSALNNVGIAFNNSENLTMLKVTQQNSSNNLALPALQNDPANYNNRNNAFRAQR